MTREEAIKIFREWTDEGFSYDGGYAVEELDDDGKEALEMAIKALSQEPCDDKRLFIKIYADYEPSVVAEKVYQICDEDEFPEVVSQLNAYLEPCDDAVSREAVLDGLRAEIAENQKVVIETLSFDKKHEFYNGKWAGLELALAIIDKHIEGSKE